MLSISFFYILSIILPMQVTALLNTTDTLAGPILESKGIATCDFSEKGQRNNEKEQNIWKFEQNCTNFENIFKKGQVTACDNCTQ